MATLYVVGTPIGNLQDLTERAREVLQTVDVIYCEDTRVTQRLLSSIGSTVKTVSVHQHSRPGVLQKLVQELLETDGSAALVTDAGTPGVSDPGGKLIETLLAIDSGVTISPIPGPSAIPAILSVAGFPTDRFTFMGFAPNKKGRDTFFTNLAEIEHTVIFFESTHRAEKALEQLVRVAPERHLVVGRELTKLHETLYRGTPTEVTAQLKAGSLKGEFVFALAPTSYATS